MFKIILLCEASVGILGAEIVTGIDTTIRYKPYTRLSDTLRRKPRVMSCLRMRIDSSVLSHRSRNSLLKASVTRIPSYSIDLE
jgi:hypothetical protein